MPPNLYSRQRTIFKLALALQLYYSVCLPELSRFSAFSGARFSGRNNLFPYPGPYDKINVTAQGSGKISADRLRK